MIVGITGYARSGKDTAAKALIDDGFKRVSIADSIRGMALQLDPVVWENGESIGKLVDIVAAKGWEQAKEYVWVRSYLQELGSVCRQTFGKDAWLWNFDRKLCEVINAHESSVTADIRYPNEADLIRQRKGMLVRITRPGVGPLNDHPTEASVADINVDIELFNSGTPEQLQANLRMAVNIWLTLHQ